jgi:hypothetical protein
MRMKRIGANALIDDYADLLYFSNMRITKWTEI